MKKGFAFPHKQISPFLRYFDVLQRKCSRKESHRLRYFEEVRKETRCVVYDSDDSSSNYAVRAFLRMELEKFLFERNFKELLYREAF
jgi:hypothetical protein